MTGSNFPEKIVGSNQMENEHEEQMLGISLAIMVGKTAKFSPNSSH